MMGSSVTGDQLFDHASEPARIDRSGIELPNGVRPELQADQHRREIGILCMATRAVGKTVEHGGQLRHDLGVQGRETSAQLRPAQRGDADFREHDAAGAVRRQLDEEEVESARQRALRVEDVELGAQRSAQILDHLVDRRDQEVFLRHEVVMHQPGGKIRLRGDALNRRLGESVFEDGGAQAFDDLAPARAGETRASH